jgi:mannose-6-phosphate isomerase-like protein (cupin superfamily)
VASWSEIEVEAPELAAEARRLLDAHVHNTIATLRRDGSPRISGTEVKFAEGELWMGSMPRSVKALDLQREPRFALHSGSEDPPDWTADAKLAGRVEEVDDPERKAAAGSPAASAVSVDPMAEPGHEIARLDETLAALRGSDEQWREFLRAGMFSAGVYRLAAGQTDTQTPHAEDEIYYVLSGRAELEVAGERHPVERGSVAFVAKHAEHRFVEIAEDLELLVLFAPPESS